MVGAQDHPVRRGSRKREGGGQTGERGEGGGFCMQEAGAPLGAQRGARGEVDAGEGLQRGLRARGVHASTGAASQEGWGWTALGQALRRKRGP